MAPRPSSTLVAATAIGVLVFGAPNLPGLRAAHMPAPDAAAPAFEVASIKQNKSGDGRASRGPAGGHLRRPTRRCGVDCTRIWDSAASAELRISADRAGSIPISSTSTRRPAKLPPGAVGPSPQLSLMLKSLLVERFKLVAHNE